MPNAYGFPNCVGWYVANQGVYSDAGTTPAAPGAGVAQWNDLSGHGNHLTQPTAGNRPAYNTYAAATTAAGPTTVGPFGGGVDTYNPSMAKTVLFDGTTSVLNIPASLALPSTGCTVVMCTRGAYYCPVSFGSDPTYSINYGWFGGSPPRMGVVNGGVRPFAAPTYLPQLTPIVHGFRASANLGETRLYVGTNQQSTYPANTCNFAMAGGSVGQTLTLNGGSYGTFPFAGELYELVVYSSPLTDGMMATLLADVQAANRLRADANRTQVVFVGDSLTAGGPGLQPMSHCYPWHLCQHFGGAFKPLLTATPGHTIAQQQAIVTNAVVPLDLTPFAATAAVVCCGSNDANSGRTGPQIAADLAAMCRGLRAAGIKVVVVTVTPRTSGGDPAAIAVALTAANAAIRSTYATFADALVDWAADPRLSDPTNATYFSDGCHTTDAGDGVKAQLVKAALDTLPGFGPAAVAPPLSYASFYAGGRSVAGTFGNFVAT